MIPTLLLCVANDKCITIHPGSHGLHADTMDKTIIGRVGEKTIPETILNYQSDICEQELTAMKNIRNKFAAQEYNPNDVVFD